MKKLFSVLIVLVAAIASTMLVSCSKNDDDKVNSQTVGISLEPNEVDKKLNSHKNPLNFFSDESVEK